MKLSCRPLLTGCLLLLSTTSMAQSVQAFRSPSGRWGFRSTDGRVLVPPRFLDEPSSFSSGVAVVRGILRKKGVINQQGQLLADTLYDDISPFRNGYALITMTIRGTDPLTGQQITRNGVGVIDSAGRIIIPPVYERIMGDFSNGWYVAVDSFGYQNHFGFTRSGERFQPPAGWTLIAVPIGPGIYLARKNGLYGFFNNRFELLLPFEFSLVKPTLHGLILVKKNQLFGVLNDQLQWVIEPRYRLMSNYRNGYAVYTNQDQRCGIVDSNGREVTAALYESITLLYSDSEPVARYRLPGQSNEGLLNAATGEKITAALYRFGSESRGLLEFWRDGKRGLINTRGQELLFGRLHDYVNGFREGRAWFLENGRYGFIDTIASVIVEPIYDDVRGFSDGLALVKKDGKIGFIDAAGLIRIPLVYTKAESFYGGIAEVTDDTGRRCFINTQGVEVID